MRRIARNGCYNASTDHERYLYQQQEAHIKEMLMTRHIIIWTRGLVYILSLTLIAAVQAQATLIDISGGQFKDTQTGYRWYDVDFYQGLSFNTVDSFLAGSTYHIATTAEITQLFNNFPVDENIAPIIGYTMSTAIGSPTVNWSASHGFFDIGDPIGVGEAAWFWDEVLNPHGSGVISYSTYNDRDSAWDYIGMWVVDTTPVPEPSALLLMGLCLIGLVKIRRKKYFKNQNTREHERIVCV
jgi:hypothetical protein